MVALFYSHNKTCTIGQVIRVARGEAWPGSEQILLTFLDRRGGGYFWGGPSGGCSRVEPWGNVTDDMAKNHVQKLSSKLKKMAFLKATNKKVR